MADIYAKFFSASGCKAGATYGNPSHDTVTTNPPVTPGLEAVPVNQLSIFIRMGPQAIKPRSRVVRSLNVCFSRNSPRVVKAA